MFMTIIFCVIAYLIGSLNSAMIVAKTMNLPDPRAEGSKNPGATNMLRIGGKQAGMIVLGADALKGLLPVWLAAIFSIPSFGLGLVAVAAVAGHIFPLYYDFKGGKGVATSLGALFGLSWLIGTVAILVWAGVAAIFQFASLASLSALAAGLLITLLSGSWGYLLPVIGIAAMVAYKHQDNIERLKAGTEPKLDLNSGETNTAKVPPKEPEDKA